MIALSNIEAVKPAQSPTQQGNRAARHGANGPVQQTEGTGRAVATQRDAFYFRTEAIVLQGAPATAPYLAQQISQLWPTAPTAARKTAIHAYAQNSLPYDGTDHKQSVLA